jgi:hypothetical protein
MSVTGMCWIYVGAKSNLGLFVGWLVLIEGLRLKVSLETQVAGSPRNITLLHLGPLSDARIGLLNFCSPGWPLLLLL